MESDSEFNATAIQAMTSDISSLGSREAEVRPVKARSKSPSRRLQARRGLVSFELRSICFGSRFATYSHGTGPLLYFRVTCPYSLSYPALLCVVKVNLESSPAEVTPLTSACYPTPEPAQVVVLRHSCSVSGLDEGVLRKRLLLLFFQTRATIRHGIPATGRSG